MCGKIDYSLGFVIYLRLLGCFTVVIKQVCVPIKSELSHRYSNMIVLFCYVSLMKSGFFITCHHYLDGIHLED